MLDYFKSQLIEEYGEDSLNKSPQTINSKLRKLYDRMKNEQKKNDFNMENHLKKVVKEN
jgi:hypothetical protein